MLSTEYRKRLEFICSRIAECQEVKLEDMIWAEKLAKANRSAGEIMRRARRLARKPNMKTDSLDGFMNAMDLGDPDPQNHRTSLDGADDIAAWFSHDRTDDWRQHD